MLLNENNSLEPRLNAHTHLHVHTGTNTHVHANSKLRILEGSPGTRLLAAVEAAQPENTACWRGAATGDRRMARWGGLTRCAHTLAGVRTQATGQLRAV